MSMSDEVYPPVCSSKVDSVVVGVLRESIQFSADRYFRRLFWLDCISKTSEFSLLLLVGFFAVQMLMLFLANIISVNYGQLPS